MRKDVKYFLKTRKRKLISFQRYLYEKILYKEKKTMQAPRHVKLRIRSNIALMTFYRKKKKKKMHKEPRGVVARVRKVLGT